MVFEVYGDTLLLNEDISVIWCCLLAAARLERNLSYKFKIDLKDTVNKSCD